MDELFVYLDESGDLGWTLHRPYRQGGSSQFLTIAALLADGAVRHKPKRVVKRLYNKFNWPTSQERKWADMNSHERSTFAQLAGDLADREAGRIRYHSITVLKRNVLQHIRADGNKLYNYMIRLLLLDQMARYDRVVLIPDQRSIKVQSGNSLHDYLQTTLWFDKGVATSLETIPSESSGTRNIQFADMLAGAVQCYFEDNIQDAYDLLQGNLNTKRLFFTASS